VFFFFRVFLLALNRTNRQTGNKVLLEERIRARNGNDDLEMLKAVGHGIAMGNASDELKEIAEEVCGHVAEDGIYYYCKEHGMI